MKRFKYIIMALVVAIGSSAVFTSCEDSDKFRFPELTNGGFVKFVFQPDVWEGLQTIEDDDGDFSITTYHIGIDPAADSFDALTEDPSGNVASYQLFVQGSFDGAPEDPIAYMSTTSFPFDVSFTGADMATLFGVDQSVFIPIDNNEDGDFTDSGDYSAFFDFTSVITLSDGTVYNSIVTGCPECSETIEDEDGNPLDPGEWNGGTIDGVLLQGGDTGANFLLPAIYWRVNYLPPSE